MSASLSAINMQKAQSDMQMLEKTMVTMMEATLSHQQYLMQTSYEGTVKRNQESTSALLRFVASENSLLGDIHLIIR